VLYRGRIIVFQRTEVLEVGFEVLVVRFVVLVVWLEVLILHGFEVLILERVYVVDFDEFQSADDVGILVKGLQRKVFEDLEAVWIRFLGDQEALRVGEEVEGVVVGAEGVVPPRRVRGHD